MDAEIRHRFPNRYRLELGSVWSTASGDREPEQPNPTEYLAPYEWERFEVSRGDERPERVRGRCVVEVDPLGAFWVRTDFEVDDAEGVAFFGQWHTEVGKAQLIGVRLWPERIKPRAAREGT